MTAILKIPKSKCTPLESENIRPRPLSGSMRVKSKATLSGRKRKPTCIRFEAIPANITNPKMGNRYLASIDTIEVHWFTAKFVSAESHALQPNCFVAYLPKNSTNCGPIISKISRPAINKRADPKS